MAKMASIGPFLAILVLLARFASCVKLWNSTDQLPANMTDACREALTGDINCSPRLFSAWEVTTRLPQDPTVLTEYCNNTCTSSLKDWTDGVEQCCGDAPYDFGGGSFQSGHDVADSLLWAHNITCLTDESSHSFCSPIIANGTADKCSDCFLKYLATLLNSYHGIGHASEDTFSALLSQCGVDPGKYPVSNWTMPVLPTPTNDRNITCYDGCYYTVQKDDTCDSIANEYGVALDRFLYQNELDFNCDSLIEGREVCVGSPCAMYTVAQNDTCVSIINEKQFSLTELLAWNPIIHRNCDNLDALKGRTICISPPGSDSYDVNVTITWGNAWVTPSAGSWTAVQTVGQPAPTSTVQTELFQRGAIPTSTFVYNPTAETLAAQYAQHCPVTEEDFDRGFDWHYLGRDCYNMLRPYCAPNIDEPPPTSTTFPSQCLPSSVMSW